MARRPATTPEAVESARRAVREAQDAEGLRIAQAVLLPLLGMSLDLTAEVVGRSRFWVSRVRNLSLRGGHDARAKRGGRRRALLREDEELQLVRLAIEQPGVFQRMTVRRALRGLLDQRSKQPVAESTITAMLNRAAPRVLEGSRGGADLEKVAFHLSRIWAFQAELGSVHPA